MDYRVEGDFMENSLFPPDYKMYIQKHYYSNDQITACNDNKNKETELISYWTGHDCFVHAFKFSKDINLKLLQCRRPGSPFDVLPV